MRRDIAFNAEGVTLRGWHYVPERTSGPVPTVVMAHGYSCVKEMYLDAFAEVFVQAGLGALVFDHHGFGASDGEPRQEIDPWQQVRDYRHAITYADTLPTVDAGRIGIWGTSYSGGHVLVVGAIDRRVRCVVAQAPFVSGYRNARRLIRADFVAAMQQLFEGDRRRRFAGEPPALLPVVADNPATPCVAPMADAWQWFTETGRTRAPAWRNEVTLRSVEMFMEYEPGAYVAQVSPTPLLMIVARDDHLTVADEALAAYERALEPKRLALVPGGHFGVYTGEFERSSAAARDWFLEHLFPARAS
jgi:hypothetical protein